MDLRTMSPAVQIPCASSNTRGTKLLHGAVAIILLCIAQVQATSVEGTTIAVTSLGDALNGDVSSVEALLSEPGFDAVITLREAILATNNTSGLNLIEFQVGGMIEVLIPLPPLNDESGGAEIDGGGIIVLDGHRLEGWQHVDPLESLDVLQHGLVITSSRNTIANLTIIRFPGDGVRLEGSSCHENTVKGCRIGTDGHEDLGNFLHGVHIIDGASQNVIGGRTQTAQNILSGNMTGVAIEQEASHNCVIGNCIGVDVSGQFALPNYHFWINAPEFVDISSFGVLLGSGASSNVIGGGLTEGNLISANHAEAIRIHGEATRANQVSGNRFVEDTRPGVPIEAWLRMAGVSILDSPKNIVGGIAPNHGNVFDGYQNKWGTAIDIAHEKSIANIVQGNEFLAAADPSPIADGQTAIRVHHGASGNLIGGTMPGAANVIFGRNGHAIETWPFNPVRGNLISGNGSYPYHIQNGWYPQFPRPEITDASPIRGIAPPCSSVDVFADPDEEGQVYLGAVEADACGIFVLDADLIAYSGWNITATATSRKGNTSMYSAPFPVSRTADGISLDPSPAEDDCACTGEAHSADNNGDWRVDLPELLLLVQLFHAERFRCMETGPDYYVTTPGVSWNPQPDGSFGIIMCTPHDADYRPRDWRIELVELMRVIQFYNSPSYTVCAGSEDGFCPNVR